MDRKKKIAIVGAGNAAITTALHYYYHGRNLFDIDVYYDPTIPIERVGQGTTIGFPTLIFKIFGIDWYKENNLIKATHKDGILYENWGRKKDKVFHPFSLTNGAIHFVPQLLSKLLVECGLFNIIEKNIDDPETEIDADFIFDCRGKNNRTPELYDELINPLNYVILGRKSEPDLSLTYTRCVATPDGWTFVIPNHDSVSYGYLFNQNITDLKTAAKNFIDLFDVIPDGHFPFQNYIAKNCFQGERTILNGNRLCFLEPLEATSIGFYLNVAMYAWDHIVGGENKIKCNLEVRNEMNRIQTFILWHYQNGSKYNTPFWDYAKSLTFNPDNEFLNMLNYVRENDFITCRDVTSTYSQWIPNSFKVWYENT